VYTIGFTDRQVTLEGFINEKKNTFFERFPEGQIHEITFDPIVTQSISSKNLAHQTLLFNATESGLYESPLGKMVVFIKTPGGFWDVSLHCPISILTDPKQISTGFVEVVKNLKIWHKNSEEQQKEKNDTNISAVSTATSTSENNNNSGN